LRAHTPLLIWVKPAPSVKRAATIEFLATTWPLTVITPLRDSVPILVLALLMAATMPSVAPAQRNTVRKSLCPLSRPDVYTALNELTFPDKPLPVSPHLTIFTLSQVFYRPGEQQAHCRISSSTQIISYLFHHDSLLILINPNMYFQRVRVHIFKLFVFTSLSSSGGTLTVALCAKLSMFIS
jgi:hypothetical protein